MNKLSGKGPVDWKSLQNMVESAEFRQYANAWEALQSGGFAGISEGKLLIAVAKPLQKIPIVNNSVIQHELVHVFQELTEKALTREAAKQVTYGQILKWEIAANIFGSPGIFLFYSGGVVAIAGGNIYVYAK